MIAPILPKVSLLIVIVRYCFCCNTFQQLRHYLVKLCGILGCNNRDTCALLHRFSRNSSSLTTLAGNCHILRKCTRRFLLGYRPALE